MNSYLASLGPSLANHLWQSTGIAAAAWLLILALRKNRARVRYGVWLAASIKFLIPFSLLMSAGNLLPHARQPVAPIVYSTMDIVEEPFAVVGEPSLPPMVHAPTMRERAEAALPLWLGILWLAGAGTVLLGWVNRWRIISGNLRKARPALEGRELGILRQLEGRIPERETLAVLPLMMSAERMEPGIFGVFRPVLVWPEQLSPRLDDEHIEAIIAHELTHVRRKDNFTALVHMVVEALFWFHPLVWWMERQMVKEREQACDETVVAIGGIAETYAESLLKTCRFCIESPLTCVAGVTGADLKHRVAAIVTGRALVEMTWPKKMMLMLAAVCVVAAPVGLGQGKAAQRLVLKAMEIAPRPVRAAEHSMIAVEEARSSAETDTSADVVEPIQSGESAEAQTAAAPLMAAAQAPVAQSQAVAPTPAQAQGMQAAISARDLTGSWQGTIALPANAPPTAKAPRMLIKVTRGGAQGAPYKGTLYLVDQTNGRAIGAPAIVVSGSDVSFAIPVMNTTYVGTLSADGKTMSGVLKPQNGAGTSIALNLTHVAEEEAWAVPEAPTPMAKDAHPKFEVVTVKPSPPNGRFQLGPQGHEFVQFGMTMDDMIGLAYAMHVDQIIGAPDWFKTEKWDIEGVPDTPGHPNSPQSEDLTHDVLATRFGMKFHYEERGLSAYVITVAKGGPKLEPTASAPGDDPNTGLGFGNASLQNMTIANFAKWFQTYVLDRPVIDRTGLTGRYDFTLKWAPDETQFQQGRESGAPRPPLSDEIAARPAIKDAMLQQLGLKIEVVKTMVTVMVIDHAEKPSAN